MKNRTCEKCRQIRLVLMGCLIVFAALAGYHWGSIIQNAQEGVRQHDVIILGVGFTLLALLTALWAEAVVTRTEMEAERSASLGALNAEEAIISKEHARELGRIVAKLSEDNSDLRYRLLSHKVHEMNEGMSQETVAAAPAVLQEWRSRAS